jgi:hypothetical protein
MEPVMSTRALLRACEARQCRASASRGAGAWLCGIQINATPAVHVLL